MKITKLSSQGLSSLQLILGLTILAIIGGAGFYVQRQDPSSKQQPTNSSPQTQPVTVTRSSSTFDIETFYNKLQTGMNPEEVIKLAGKQPDDCSMTDSEPPSQNCFWYSGEKTVNVSYGNKNAVQAKNKTGF